MKTKRFKIEYVDHVFGPNETIMAVVRKINKDETLSGVLLEQLLVAFNSVNGFEVPVIGKVYKIPTLK